jgi:tetratricopeptide (TPR) repeat protein
MKKFKYLLNILFAVVFSQCTQPSQGNQAIEDTVSINLQKAQVLVQQSKMKEASVILTNVMATHPNNREAVQWWLIANMKRTPTGEVDAIPMLDSLSKVYPSNTGIIFFKIFIQAEYGMNQEALNTVEQLILIQPDSADNWILKGEILHGLDRYLDACNAFDTAIKLNPSRTDVLEMKTSSLSKLGKYEEALALMNKVVELSPNDSGSYYNRGCIYCLMGDKKNALVDLKKAFSMNTNLKKHALTDSDLKNLYEDMDFIELTK